MSPPDLNPPAPTKPEKRALILVVERNPIVQRLERFFLEQAGFGVEFTEDGLAALARAQQLKPRIVVTEILVPKLDGLSLCRTLKSGAETKDILVMIFSHLQADDRAREAGADAFLSKPLDEELLITTLEKTTGFAKAIGGRRILMADRILTGCAGLDEVLGGGIPANTISVIMGAPGTGKTILAEQLAFANATAEAPALYLTTLSEPLEKIIVHGQTQQFFDSDKVGVSMLYEDLGVMLRQSGIDQLPELVTNLLMEHKPRFVFIDSFKALTELMVTPQQRRTVIYDLASVLSSYQCTSFLVGEYAQETMTELPEFAIADVVLQLLKYSTNVREQRFLRVEKLRGSSSIPGLHALSINGDGVEVYPRLLTPTITPNYSPKLERVETGISNLDDMIAEGFWRGSTTLIAGPTGSGKTIIGLHFITQGALKGEHGLYVGFQENPTQLARVMQNLGWDAKKLLSGDSFNLLYKSPVELQLDTITSELSRRVREGKIKRVVIDALGDLERSSMDRQRFADFIYALTQWFAAENVTCLTMYELTNLFEVHGISNQEISNMADNVILLRFKPGPEMQRTLRIIKTRGSAHDNREHELQITSKGVIVKKA